MQLNYQHQILVGTILGGSSLTCPSNGKNHHLVMRSQNPLWLRYKMAELSSYYEGKNLLQYGRSYRAYSNSSEKLTEYHAELYQNGKRFVKMQTLDLLRDIALAIWFLDGGGLAGRDRKNAYLNTTKFGVEGAGIVCKYFNEIGISGKINKDGKRTKILFSLDGTKRFFATTAHCFPSFMV